MGQITTRIAKELDRNLLSVWQALWESSSFAHFYNSPVWFFTCLEAFLIRDYLVFVFEKEGEAVGIFPLTYGKKFGVKVLSSPGGESLDKSTLLIKEKDPALIAEIFNQLQKFGNLYLAEVNQEIAAILPDGRDTLKVFASVSPYLPIEDDPFRFLPKKQKSMIFNRYRRYEKYLSFKHHTDDIDRHLLTVKEIDLESAKKLKGWKTFSDSKDNLSLVKELNKKSPGSVSIDILYWKKRPIVYGIGFLFKKTYAGVQTGYLLEFGGITPGKIVHYLLLKMLKDKNYELFDFSRGEGILKKDFTPLKAINYDVYFSKNVLARFWWKIAIFVIASLKSNVYFYEAFCAIRKNIFFVKRAFSFG